MSKATPHTTAPAVPATRRALLTGVAAASVALAVPTIAAGAASTDPIYAAIETHKAAFNFHGECIDKASKLETIVFAARRAYENAPEALKVEAAERFLPALLPTHPDATPATARRMLDAVAREEIDKDHETEIAEADRLQAEGCDAEWSATRALVATVPTTAAGVTAMIEYTLSIIDGGYDDLLTCSAVRVGADGTADDEGPTYGETLLRSILQFVAVQS